MRRRLLPPSSLFLAVFEDEEAKTTLSSLFLAVFEDEKAKTNLSSLFLAVFEDEEAKTTLSSLFLAAFEDENRLKHGVQPHSGLRQGWVCFNGYAEGG